VISRQEYHNTKRRSQNHDTMTDSDEKVPNEIDIKTAKSQRLARKLNWTIFILLLGIVGVYLILIYVNP
jgi:tetrahydromethanopterin S-methyltransferase subunit G